MSSNLPPEERATDAMDDAADAATRKVDQAADAAESTVAGAGASAQEQVRDTAASAQEAVRGARDQVTGKVRETEAKLRRQLDAVTDASGELKGLSEPTPAKSVDQAVEQAATLRRSIDADLDALQARMPPGEEIADKARQVGGIVLAVLGVAAAGFLAQKGRAERKRVEREAQAHAAAIARYLPQASAAPRPDPDEGGGKGKVLVLLAVIGAIAGFVASRQQGDDGEPDIWGPAR